ncbi:MAG: glycosyltransferase, partial [Patescibacteria group bacterium]
MLATIMPSAKRILLLVTQADWGGVQSFLIHFATELKKEGHEVLLAAGGEGELWAEAERQGIHTHRLTHVRRDINLIEDWRAIRELTRLYRSFRPDAIHLNSSKMGVLGSLAATSDKRQATNSHPRVVYRIGGWSFLEPMASWKQWIYRTAETVSAKYKDVIITVHPGDEMLAKKLGIVPRERIVTVPNGLDVAAFVSRLKTRMDARRALGIPERAFVIGTIANAYPTKALLPYLNVLKRMCDEDRGVVAVIIGNGPEF